MTKVAKMVKDVSEHFNGTALLYSVPEFEWFDWDGKPEGSASHIVASAVNGWACETYLFPADENGTVLSWSELDGSEKNTADHDQCMRNAGYVVERE